MAAAETIAMAAAVFLCAQTSWPEPVWAAALVAPMLLLKTRASIALGSQRFAALMHRLGLKARISGVSAPSLPLRLLGLGVGSVAIKMLTTPYCVFRSPTAAIKAMPGNLREQCLEIDLACAPELIPGMERAYDRDPHSAFLFSDLLRPYDRKSGPRDYASGSWNRPNRQTIVAAPFLAVFFAVATIYRLYVKAAAVLYLPLLLIEVPDRRRLRERTTAGSKAVGVLTKSMIQFSVGGLALIVLLRLAGQPALAAAVGGWLDDNLLAIWGAASVSQWMPKVVLSLLFFQAAVYLAAVGSETRARWARADVVERTPSTLARRWIEIARALYAVHACIIVAVVVNVFLAVAPNSVLIAKGAWSFFF